MNTLVALKVNGLADRTNVAWVLINRQDHVKANQVACQDAAAKPTKWPVKMQLLR